MRNCSHWKKNILWLWMQFKRSSKRNKYSDRSMEVLFLVLLGNYNRPTNQQPTNRPSNQTVKFSVTNWQSDNMVHREVTLPKSKKCTKVTCKKNHSQWFGEAFLFSWCFVCGAKYKFSFLNMHINKDPSTNQTILYYKHKIQEYKH